MKKNIKSTLYEPSFLLMTTGTPTLPLSKKLKTIILTFLRRIYF